MRCTTRLVKYDNAGRAVPLLATKWPTPNPKTTIVTIRKGVKFHNGNPMRVEDVVWSLNRIHDPVKPASNNFLALPKDIWGKATKINDTQFRIMTKKPTRMIENFRFWFIMPENADDLNLGQRPIGTGPFQYKNFVKGDRLELEGFRDYWNGSRPYLERADVPLPRRRGGAGRQLPLRGRPVPSRSRGRDSAPGAGQAELEADSVRASCSSGGSRRCTRVR